MINKIVQRLRFYRSIRFFHYLYLNHFCSRVIRTDQSRIIPHRGAVVELEPGAKLYLRGGDLELGCDRLRHSREETLVRLRRDAVWSCDGGCRISYGATIEVLTNALLDSGFFTMNSRSVLVTAKRIRRGWDVMIGRGVVIYDSDHHTIRNAQGQITKPGCARLYRRPCVAGHQCDGAQGQHHWIRQHRCCQQHGPRNRSCQFHVSE